MQQLALAPPHSIRRFRGPEDTIRTMVSMVKGQRGEHSVYLRSLTEQVVRGLQPKDYLGEILAVRNFCAERIRYMNDPLTMELVKDPQRIAEEIAARGRAVGDCFPEGTLLAVEGDSRRRRIENVSVGDRIWGLDDWTLVEAIAEKGVMRLDRVRLTNGASFSVTGDHKVYVQKCVRHDGPCECRRDERIEARIRLSELQPGMMLTQPSGLQHYGGSRVERIERNWSEAPCLDIQTADHRVFLPDAVVTVSNCDDIASFSSAMLRQLGREAQFVTVGFNRPNHYSHVFTRVKEPKSGKWYVCDPVAGTDEGTMLRRVKTYRFWQID